MTATPVTSTHSPRRMLTVGLALLALLFAGSAGAGTAATDIAGAAAPLVVATGVTPVPRPAHTVVVVLENKDHGSVLGSASAPFLNDLARRGANLSQSYGVTHPSQPNYLALFSGGQQGVTTNACTDLGNRPNLGSQLQAAGLSFTGYAESMPRAGYTGCVSGRYQRKHNPWVSFANLAPGVNQPFTSFPTDYNRLPTVSFVSPNMCHDMHDCSVATGDAWLARNLDGYARWAMTHNSLLVVTFDENAGGSVNDQLWTPPPALHLRCPATDLTAAGMIVRDTSTGRLAVPRPEAAGAGGGFDLSFGWPRLVGSSTVRAGGGSARPAHPT